MARSHRHYFVSPVYATQKHHAKHYDKRAERRAVNVLLKSERFEDITPAERRAPPRGSE